MFEKEIEDQRELVLTLMTELSFFDILLAEASSFGELEGEDDSSTQAYINSINERKEKAEEIYFESLAELWLLESNNFVLEEDEA